MQNLTTARRSSRLRLIAVLAIVGTLTTLAAASSDRLAHFVQNVHQTARSARTDNWRASSGCLVGCPGGANVCPGGTLTPAYVLNNP